MKKSEIGRKKNLRSLHTFVKMQDFVKEKDKTDKLLCAALS